MKKRLISLFTALCVAAGAVVFDGTAGVAGIAASAAADGDCDGTHDGWMEWTETTKLPTDAGKYCLTADVTVTKETTITADITLCLNGHIITNTGTEQTNNIFNVSGEAGNFTLCDCKKSGKLTGGHVEFRNGAAVSVFDGGKFTMYGGTISDCSTTNGGGGVEICGDSTFIMNGGTISANTAGSTGGGVYIIDTGIFTMNGGTISGNTAGTYGGGVFISTNGTFTMNGGSILNNTATTYGGGGVYQYGTFIINGEVTISGNTYNGNVNNVGFYWRTSPVITVGDNFSTESKIGVTGSTTLSNCQSSSTITDTVNTDVSESFISDKGYTVVYEDNTVKLVGPHKLRATAAKDPTCTVEGNEAYWSCSTSNCYKIFSDVNGTTETTLTEVTIPAKGHTLTKTEAKAATCTANGNSAYWTCSSCNKIFSDVNGTTGTTLTEATISATGHSYGGWTITKDPSLTETGTAERVCANDNTHKDTKELPVLDDTTVWTKDEDKSEAPTEEKEGKDVYMSDYGEVTVVLDKLPHTHVWGDWTITAKPTLTEKGAATHTCTKDSTHTETAELPDLSDTTVWTKVADQHVEPTEEQEGKDVYTSEYGEVEIVLPKKDHIHTLAKTESKAATCTEDGNAAYWTCSSCNKIFSDENGTTEISAVPTVSALGHTEVTDAAVDPTCTFDGKTEGKHCGVCQTVLTAQTVVPATGHNWVDGVVTLEPTEDSDGVKTFTCANCGETKTETIPSLNHVHSLVPHEKVDADCVNAGTVEYWHCETCGNDYGDEAAANQLTEIAIPALGHDFDEGTVTTAPNCTEKGVKTSTCRRDACHETKTEEIPATGHTAVTDAVKAPTCTEAGLTEGSHCSVCQTILTEREVIPARGHAWDGGVITTEPTASAEGIKTYTCAICGATETEKLPATGGADTPSDPNTPDTPDNPSEPESGNITTEVEPGANAPITELKTPKDELIDATLTPEEQKRTEEGIDIKIILKVEDGTATVSAEDKATVERTIGGSNGYTLGQYLDVELLKIIGGTQEKIRETSAEITVTFALPESLRKAGRAYAVIRVHEGAATILPDLDGDDATVTIRTDKFSTYALAYSDGENAQPNPPTTTPSIVRPPVNPTPAVTTAPTVTTTPAVTTPTERDEIEDEEGDAVDEIEDDGESDVPDDDEEDEDDVSDDEDEEDDDVDDTDDGTPSDEKNESATDTGNAVGAVDAADNAEPANAANAENTADGDDRNPPTGVGFGSGVIVILLSGAAAIGARKRKKKGDL
ncbi:MAG: autotransporter adhesin family protein [Bacteroides sp.]|nr:autotransporter adhesin family protein [Eubacterium sp.]MCM1418412.1 autotransporter adhesin family protein [Roseburia sp.]MCM1461566.1 autotransporter adhesin family protein [Bacteroides sp.]